MHPLPPLFNLAGAAVFVLWLVLSVFNQFKNNFITHFHRFDIGHLLPRWTFFAPTPGTSDYHLVFRDLDEADKPVTGWQEVALSGRSRYAIVWNPQKRARKVVTDMTQGLLQFAINNPEGAPFTIPYLALLQRVIQHCPPAPGAHCRQFALAKTEGPDATAEATMLFRSAAHPFVTPPPAASQTEAAQTPQPTEVTHDTHA